jgi:sporulation protein YlmC with PRC-barrel domain
MDGASSVQSLGNLFTTTTTNVGSVDDIIITPEKAVSYAIIGTGGFLGLAKHDVAIPVSQFKLVDKKLVLPGATKDALKAIPEFQYAQ